MVRGEMVCEQCWARRKIKGLQEIRTMGKEVAVVGGLGLLALTGALYAMSREKAPEPGEPPQDGIEIYWYDAEGNPLPRNSPVTIEEGKTAYFDVYITNTSTKGGEPWPVTFDIMIGATYGPPNYLPMMTPIWKPGELFEGGQRKGPFSGSLTPMLGSADWDGSLTVGVFVGTAEVASAVDPINIIYVPIIYGAIIEF